MPKTEKRNWFVAPAVLMLVCTVASLNGVLPLTAFLLVLPVVSAVLNYTAGNLCVGAVCAVSVACSVMTMPKASWPVVLPWCVLSGLIAAVPVRNAKIRPVLWTAFVLAAWTGCILLLRGIFGEQIHDGLAKSCCDWIGSNPRRDEILLKAYSMGIARTSQNFIRLSDEIRAEMLFSLRVSLNEMIPEILCNAIIYHTALTALLCVLIPDWRRRRNGEPGLLPAMDQWYIPRGIGLAIGLLAIGWVMVFLSENGVIRYLGLMFTTVFRTAYLLQGVCLLQWLEKKIGVKSAARNLWAILLSVLAPIVPIVMGMIDQRRDARHLRPNEEADGV